ncbi:MAG TPA: hypothetical protein VFQ35_18050 [Polyangiaceae bacterium]|nr:hypothetical protein [Polyangiaceae bacterium]
MSRGLGARAGFAFGVSALVCGSGCATSEDIPLDQLERGGRSAELGGAPGSGGAESGGTTSGLGGTTAADGGTTLGAGGKASGSGGAMGGAGRTGSGSGGRTATGSGGRTGTGLGSGGRTAAGSGGRTGFGTGGRTGTAGQSSTAGAGSCDWTGCATSNCTAGCPTTDGGYCSKACTDMVTCFQMNPGCSKSGDPLCVMRNNGAANVCTTKWESAGGQQTGPAATGPSQAAARYISCACDLTIPGVTPGM